MSVRSRIFKVGAAKSLEVVLITVVRFLSVPLFLKAWGVHLYGEWLVLYSFLAYLTMANLGLAQAAANEMTMSVTRESRDEAVTTYQSTFLFLLLLSLLILALAVTLPRLLPLLAWTHFTRIHASALSLVLLLFSTYVAATFLMDLLIAGYRCNGNYHRGILGRSASLLLEFLALIAVVSFGGGPVAVATSMIAARGLVLISMAIDLGLLSPWLKLGISLARWSEMKRLVSPSLSFIGFPAGRTLINQGVVIAIGSILGPAAVVLFTSLRSLTNLVVQAFNLVNQALYPEIAMAWARRDGTLLKRLHRMSCRVSIWLGLASLLGLLAFGPWVFRIWTRGAVAIDLNLFWGFLGLLALRSLWLTSFVVPSAINQHQRLTVGYLITSAVGLGVSVFLVQRHHLASSLVGFAVVDLAMIVLVLPRSLNIAQDTLGGFLGALATPPNPMSLFRQSRQSRSR